MITPNVEKGYIITTTQPTFARATQCVLVGFNNLEKQLSGIAHLHYTANHEKILDNFFNETIKQSGQYFEIQICGGVDFKRGGFDDLPGSQTADKVMDYLIKNNLELYISSKDLYQNYPREMEVIPKQPCNQLILRRDLLRQII